MIKPLEWSEERGPDDKVYYNYVEAETPFGTIIISWRGWKEHPTYDASENAPFEALLNVYEVSLDDAKNTVEKIWQEKIQACLEYPVPQERAAGLKQRGLL